MWRPSDPGACERVDERLEAWVDDDLDATERTLVERHLEACEHCRRQSELAIALRNELRELPRWDAAAETLERVIRAASVEPAGRAGRRPGWTRLPWSVSRRRAAAIGLLAAAALAVALLPPGRRAADGSRQMPPGAAAQAARDPSVAVPPPLGPGTPALTREEIDPVEVRRAAGEARLAFAYLSRASRRAGLELRDELIDDLLGERLAGPAAEGLRALGMRIRDEERHDET
jgi:hypothetical protein